MRSSRLRSVAGVVAIVVLGACGGGGDRDAASPSVPTSAPVSAPVVRTLPATVEVTSSGAVEVSYRAETDLTVSVFRPGRPDLTLLTVGLAEERQAGDVAFRTAFDLAGLYTGPARYTLPAIGSSSGASSISTAFLQGTRASAMFRFDRAVEPCVVEVGSEERTGSIACPRLEDATGATVSLRMAWAADEPSAGG